MRKYAYATSPIEMAIEFAEHFRISHDRDNPTIVTHMEMDKFCWEKGWYTDDGRELTDHRHAIRSKINTATLGDEFRSITNIPPYQIETRIKGRDCLVRPNDLACEASILAFPSEIRANIAARGKRLKNLERSIPEGFSDVETILRIRSKSRSIEKTMQFLSYHLSETLKEFQAIDADIAALEKHILPAPDREAG